jgi:threonine/homoserine/homoserine lactone efflux protein
VVRRRGRGCHAAVVDAAALPAFLLAVLLIAASPGPAMALIVRRAGLRGFRAAVPTVLGLEAGLFAWALVAGAGLAALVAASEVAFLVLRVVGALVLVVLGVQAWRAAWRTRRQPDAATPHPAALGRDRRSGRVAFAEGAVVNLANPKAAVFMVAFYPQFVPADSAVMATTAALATLQVAVEAALYLALAAGVGRAGAWFARPGVQRRFEALSGTVLLGLGVRVATTAR